jgi:nucleoside-diphosphate-sugar epimerase
MKLLLTGASGFVGTALLNAPRSRNFTVQAMVRSPAQVKGLPADVQPLVMTSLPELAQQPDLLTGVDCIVHLAARVHVMRDRLANPLAAFRAVNTEATAALARAAAAAGVRRFVYLSSIKVNGEGQADCPPLTQKTYTAASKPNPQDPYGISKWEAETALHEIAAETGLEVVVIRPPLVYGPQVKANFLQLMKAVRSGIPLPFGGVKNSRSLVFVDNLVDAILASAEHPAAPGHTFLVSDGEDVSTAGLIRQLAIALDRPARLLPIPPFTLQMAGQLTGKSAAVQRLLSSLTVDNGLICRTLDWSPNYCLEQSLKITADWYLESRMKT